MHPKSEFLRLGLAALLFAALPPSHANAAAAEPARDVLQRSAVQLREQGRAAMLDVASAGARLVAVGERGYVGISEDGGKRWRQVPVPVSVTLTAVHFPVPQKGWAVGHSGVVLHTSNAGDTWKLQANGSTLAAAELRAAQAAGGDASSPRQQAATRLVKEGPDKPLLAVHFSDAKTGVVAGAYGLLFATQDGGATWQSWMDRIDNPKSLHLFAVENGPQSLCIAGEQGMLAVSTDAGQSFKRLASPYRGSFFVVSCQHFDRVLAAGLNGNAALTADGGKTWIRPEGLIGVGSVVALRAYGGRTVWFASQSGTLLKSEDGGKRFVALSNTAGPLASFALLPDGSKLILGLDGTRTVKPLQNAVTGE